MKTLIFWGPFPPPNFLPSIVRNSLELCHAPISALDGENSIKSRAPSQTVHFISGIRGRDGTDMINNERGQ